MARKPATVSQLNSYIGRVLSTDPLLSAVSVIGEVSNLKYHSTGVYLSLKDDASKIGCYISPSVASRLRYELDEDMEIIAHGYINVYQRGGTYSVNIRDIEVQGEGELAIAFEKLKVKLSAEGLFDPAAKKPLPEFPRKVGVVTSPTGAAVEDIKKIIRSRNNIVDILIYPVLVQGPGAAPSIAAAVKDLNEKYPDIDVMIVGRGGGSLEELWAFNEEIVARAIYESEIPVISAVGHETDFTIADFVADMRAETPTAAAAMAVPDIGELKAYIEDKKESLKDALDGTIRKKEQKLRALDIENLEKRLLDRIEISRLRCSALMDTLSHLNPQNVMKRGFAAVTDADGRFIKNISDVKKGDIINTIISDGKIISEVKDIRR